MTHFTEVLLPAQRSNCHRETGQYQPPLVSVKPSDPGQAAAELQRTLTTLNGRVTPSCSVIETYSSGLKTWASNR